MDATASLGNVTSLLFGLIASVFVTLVLIPPLSRAAASLHLLDIPSGRKAHDVPTPRVGGIGIAVAVIVSILVWAPVNPQMLGYIAGAFWILVFGIWDDIKEMGYRSKLLGQVPAVAAAIYSGIVMNHVPFFGLDPAPMWISVAVTILFILGVTNAINLFDGLDGLAGGCVLLSLGVIAYLAFKVQGWEVTLLAVATMGAILGFLNFNTYPARVFLGDAGSQFLGFSIAILSILLTETVHTALNPALPLFLVGLPLLDTIWVFGLRISQGRSPFRGDRQHIHHQLLMCGLSHAGAVSVIYLMQIIFIGSALLLTYQSDIIVVGVFCIESIVFLALVLWAKSMRGDGNANGSKLVGRRQYYNQLTMKLKLPDWLHNAAGYFTEVGLSLFLVLGVFLSNPPSKDTALVCLAVAALLAFAALFLRPWSYLFTRVGVYVSSLVAIFSYSQHYERSGLSAVLLSSYLGLLVLSIVLCVRQERRLQFRIVPQDLLIVFFALAAPLLPKDLFGDSPVGFLVISAVILFYICEYLISFTEYRHRILRVCTFLALVTYGMMGLVI